MKTENLPKHRYLAVTEDISGYIGKEVFVRWSTDWGDETFWEKGILVSVEPDSMQFAKSNKGIWKASIGNSVRTFEWCAIEIE